MDIGFFRSAPEEQLEVLTVIQQMDKLPDLFGAYNDIVSTEYTDTQGSGSSSTNTDPSIAGNWSQVGETTSPTFMHHLPSTISFNGRSPSLQEQPPLQAAAEFPFLSRLRNDENGDNVDSRSTTQAQKHSSMVTMREMIFRIAAMQPIHIDPESVKPVKRRNVKISKDPQSVAARHRRERISERIRILQKLVPGGTKMDTASMLDEAIHYVKFLKKQVQSLEKSGGATTTGMGFPVPMNSGNFIQLQLQAMKGYQLSSGQNVEQYY